MESCEALGAALGSIGSTTISRQVIKAGRSKLMFLDVLIIVLEQIRQLDLDLVAELGVQILVGEKHLAEVLLHLRDRPPCFGELFLELVFGVDLILCVAAE